MTNVRKHVVHKIMWGIYCRGLHILILRRFKWGIRATLQKICFDYFISTKWCHTSVNLVSIVGRTLSSREGIFHTARFGYSTYLDGGGWSCHSITRWELKLWVSHAISISSARLYTVLLTSKSLLFNRLGFSCTCGLIFLKIVYSILSTNV